MAIRLTASLVILLVLASANVTRPVLSRPSEPYAALARLAASSSTAPVWTFDHSPSVVFYTGGRPVNTSAQLSDFVAAVPTASAVDSVIRTDQAAELTQCCDVTTVAERDDYSYARITKR